MKKIIICLGFLLSSGAQAMDTPCDLRSLEPKMQEGMLWFLHYKELPFPVKWSSVKTSCRMENGTRPETELLRCKTEFTSENGTAFAVVYNTGEREVSVEFDNLMDTEGNFYPDRCKVVNPGGSFNMGNTDNMMAVMNIGSGIMFWGKGPAMAAFDVYVYDAPEGGTDDGLVRPH